MWRERLSVELLSQHHNSNTVFWIKFEFEGSRTKCVGSQTKISLLNASLSNRLELNILYNGYESTNSRAASASADASSTGGESENYARYDSKNGGNLL
ncbi:MAG: hypothetical protein ACI90V_012309 [Bacillariaceae sp.]|jgi:hypothetical protein